MKNSKLLLTSVFLTISITGCDSDDGERSSQPQQFDGPLEKVAPEDRYVAVEEINYLAGEICTSQRADRQGEFTVGEGNWGEWANCWHYCPAGHYAYDVWVRSEGSQGSGDDTAANALSFGCYKKTDGSYSGEIRNHEGFWGTWGNNPISSSWSNPIIGGKIRIEAPIGDGDDTSANGFVAKLKNGSTLTPSSQTGWGAWTPYSTCPIGQAVCGIKIRLETQQGSGGDDTALNGVRLACCTF